MDHLKRLLSENGKVHWRELATVASLTGQKSKKLLEDCDASSVWVKWEEVEAENEADLSFQPDLPMEVTESRSRKRVYSFEKCAGSIVCVFDKNHEKIKDVVDSPIKLVQHTSKTVDFTERNRNPILRKIVYKFTSDMEYLKARYTPVKEYQLAGVKDLPKPEKKPMKGLDKLKGKLENQASTKNKAEEVKKVVKAEKLVKPEDDMEVEELKEAKMAGKVKPVKKTGKIDFSKVKPKKVIEKVVKVEKQKSPPKKPKKSEVERPKIDFSDGSDEEPEIIQKKNKRVGRAVINDSSSEEEAEETPRPLSAQSTDSTQKMQSLQLNSDNESTSSTENREPDDKESENQEPKPTHKTIVKMEKSTVMERYTDEDGFMHTINKVVTKPKEVTVKIGSGKSSVSGKVKEKKEKKVLKHVSSKGKGKSQSIQSFFKPK